MRIRLLILGIILSSHYSFNPIVIADFVPTKEVLTESLSSHYKKILHFVALERREKNKGLFFSLLPILGFDFIKTSPIFYISSKSLTNQLAKNSEGLSKVYAAKIDFLEAISELMKLYDDLIDEIEVYNEHIRVHEIQTEVKKIKEGLYSKGLLTPSDFYNFLENFNEKEYVLAQSLLRIKQLRNKLIAFSYLKSHEYDSRI